MKNYALMILMLSTILIFVAYAIAGSLAAPFSGPVCPDGMILCNETCINITTPCNQSCPDDMILCNGTCINITTPCNQSCPDGMIPCNGTCVDILTDTQNCGSCGNICSLGMICIKGECSCLKGMIPCNDTCTDTSVDPKNCGTCGNVCPGKTICDDGRCIDQYANVCIDGDCSSLIVVQHRNIDAES